MKTHALSTNDLRTLVRNQLIADLMNDDEFTAEESLALSRILKNARLFSDLAHALSLIYSSESHYLTFEEADEYIRGEIERIRSIHSESDLS